MPTPVITTFTLGPYETNCFIVTPREPGPGEPCWIVDCGFEPDEMLRWIEAQQLKPQAIILTHAHVDHIAGVDQALSRIGSAHSVPIMIHEDEAAFCADPLLNLSALSGMPVTCSPPTKTLRDGDELTLGDASGRWRVLHTPGHSPGGIAIIHDDSKQAIVGDTLFAGSIGRHDFPTSDPRKLQHSLLHVLMKLPDDMTIHPGHGPATTIGEERRSNPFLRGGL